MEAKELKKIVKQMKILGVIHFKTAEFELSLSPEAVSKIAPEPKAAPVKDLTDEEHKEIQHKIEQLKSLMLGSDDDLMNRLFPVPSEDLHESVQ